MLQTTNRTQRTLAAMHRCSVVAAQVMLFPKYAHFENVTDSRCFELVA